MILLSRIVSALVLPPPNVSISSSGDSIAGQEYSLECSTSVVDGLVVLPDLKIVGPNSTMSLMSTSSLVYMFSTLRISDGGLYTCTATVNITGVTFHQSPTTGTIIVASEYYYNYQSS